MFFPSYIILHCANLFKYKANIYIRARNRFFPSMPCHFLSTLTTDITDFNSLSLVETGNICSSCWNKNVMGISGKNLYFFHGEFSDCCTALCYKYCGGSSIRSLNKRAAGNSHVWTIRRMWGLSNKAMDYSFVDIGRFSALDQSERCIIGNLFREC